MHWAWAFQQVILGREPGHLAKFNYQNSERSLANAADFARCHPEAAASANREMVDVTARDSEPSALRRHRDALMAAAGTLGNRIWTPDWKSPAQALQHAVSEKAEDGLASATSLSHWEYVFGVPREWDAEPVFDALRAHTADHPCWTAYARFLDCYAEYWAHLEMLVRQVVAECQTLQGRYLDGPGRGLIPYATARWDSVELLSFALFQTCGTVPGTVLFTPAHWAWAAGYRQNGESLSWGGAAIARGNAEWLDEARSAHQELILRLMKDAGVAAFADLCERLSQAKNEAKAELARLRREDLGHAPLSCCPAVVVDPATPAM